MTPAAALRRTPLTDLHEAAGARVVDFSGFAMPVQYDGILDEVKRVRAKGGLFDLCHMGRVRILGDRREEAAQWLVHPNISKMKHGAIRYTFLCREDGTTMDDVLVYRDLDEVFFCINAGNRDRDIAWMTEAVARFDCTLEDLSEDLAMIALQGRISTDTLAPLVEGEVPDIIRRPEQSGLGALKYYAFFRGKVCGEPAMISRTGYTGEDGYELYFATGKAKEIWGALQSGGESLGLAPIGLGARDTLRLEAGMALYGHELDDTTNPVEAGLLPKMVKHTHDFSGRAALEAIIAEGPKRRLVGFTTGSPRVPRQGYELFAEAEGGQAVGTVCSGSPSPTLDTTVGTAYVATAAAEPGTALHMDVRGKRFPVELAALPFYKRDY